MKNLFLIMSLFILLASCSYTPEQRAEKVVKAYCEAIQDGDYEKEASLTYDNDIAEDATEVSEEPALVSNLDIKVSRKCVINKNSKFEIVAVKGIYSSPSLNETPVAVGDTMEEDSAAVVEDDEPTYVEEKPTQNTISWPSDVLRSFQVVVKAENSEIFFVVVQLDERTYKIFSTKGLYKYDLSQAIKVTGCKPTFPDVDDETMSKNVDRFTNDIRTFDIFSKAITANDSAKIFAIFPRLKDNEFQFKGSPSPKSYTLNGNNAVITTNDSLAFELSSAGKIIDSNGVISTKKAEDAVKALDGTPYNRGSSFDLEYINILSDQVSSLEREKERKARAAKYKAQGVALISSHFSSDENGAKGVEFSALNTSNKTAKYIIMEVVGYNAVDDPIWSNGYLKRCRGIGPIEPGEGATWDFNKIWDNGKLVKSYEIKTLIIQFNDGTSKSVKLPQNLPSNWRNWLY